MDSNTHRTKTRRRKHTGQFFIFHFSFLHVEHDLFFLISQFGNAAFTREFFALFFSCLICIHVDAHLSFFIWFDYLYS